MSQWEEVANDPWTLRLRVPGGWLYCVVALSEGGSQYTQAVTFVPECREPLAESELSDVLLEALREIISDSGCSAYAAQVAEAAIAKAEGR